MNRAATDRAALAAVGRDLATLLGDPGTRRAAALLGAVPPATPATFAELALVPDWLRRGREPLAQLARAAAVVALAPTLATSIDGAWLGHIARHVGEATLDRATALADQVPLGGVAAVPAELLDALGFDLLREALPQCLRSYLDWAPRRGVALGSVVADFCVARALDLIADEDAAEAA